MECPHCGHGWSRHGARCADCGCLWTDPATAAPPVIERPDAPEYPYEGVISADILYEAFWAAAKTIGDDDSVHGMDHPYMDQEMDMIDTSGAGMPHQFWEHMARALIHGD
jgi:hypothetical protein